MDAQAVEDAVGMTKGSYIRIFIAVLLVIVLVGCGKQQKTAENSKQVSDKALAENLTQNVNTFTLSSVGDDGTSNWKLEGDSADIVEDNVNIKNVRIKSQSKDSAVTMTCKKGLIKKSQDLGIFKEDVLLVYDDGTTVATDAINWSFKNQIAQASGPVCVKSGGLQTKADGAYLKKGVNEIQLNKNVLMNTDSGTTIRCSGPLMLDYKKNIAVFNKDVQIENQRGKMFSKKMVAFFDPGKKKVTKVEATGNVKLIRGASVSMSDKAVYYADDGRAVLTGNPVVFVDSEEAKKIAKEQ